MYKYRLQIKLDLKNVSMPNNGSICDSIFPCHTQVGSLTHSDYCGRRNVPPALVKEDIFLMLPEFRLDSKPRGAKIAPETV
jgi:hypothetical protein